MNANSADGCEHNLNFSHCHCELTDSSDHLIVLTLSQCVRVCVMAGAERCLLHNRSCREKALNTIKCVLNSLHIDPATITNYDCGDLFLHPAHSDL